MVRSVIKNDFNSILSYLILTSMGFNFPVNYDGTRAEISYSFLDYELGKQFKDVALIYKHKVTVHMKIKSFQCDNCEFVCGTVSNLNLHRIKIHQSKDRLSILSDFKTSYRVIPQK